MNSWYQLLLLQWAEGKYLHLSPRLSTRYDWWALWSLIQQEQVRVT